MGHNRRSERAYLEGAGPFPQRSALNMLGGRFLTDFYVMVAQWAEWATGVVETWPDDPLEAVPDRAAIAEGVRRAERIAGRT